MHYQALHAFIVLITPYCVPIAYIGWDGFSISGNVTLRGDIKQQHSVHTARLFQSVQQRFKC